MFARKVSIANRPHGINPKVTENTRLNNHTNATIPNIHQRGKLP